MLNQISAPGLFDCLSAKCSRLTTLTYSTSFSLASSILKRPTRQAIYSIYGFVRFADEIVDSFHSFDKATLLVEFKLATAQAIERGVSLNPILHSFQRCVREFAIEAPLIEAFFHSMELDLSGRDYNQEDFREYIYGSAEVVGLMCLRVFAEGNDNWYQKQAPSARALGAAFQKVNFLRDLKHDQETLGRSYFPQVPGAEFSASQKIAIEEDIEKDFALAHAGIGQLPRSARAGVYLAYLYYRALFRRLRAVSAAEIKRTRIRVPDFEKLYLLCLACCRSCTGKL